MGAGYLSKFSKLKDFNCCVFLHPNQTCIQGFQNSAVTYFLGSLNLYTPVIVIPILLKYNKMTSEKLLKELKYFIETVLSSYFLTLVTCTNICIFGNMFKEFHPPILYLSGWCAGGLGALFFKDKTMKLFRLSVFESVLEIWFNSEIDPLSRAINRQKLLQTFLFMITSSIILHLKSVHNYQGFWFIKPAISESTKSSNQQHSKCNHNGSCKNFFWSGIRTYGAIGMALTIVKTILTGRPQNANNLTNILINKFKSINFNAVTFLICHVGVYRGINCLLNHYKKDSSLHTSHKVASFLSGLSYMFYPNKLFLAYSLILSTEFLLENYKNNNVSSEKNILKILIKYPWDRIMLPFGLGLIIHCFVFHHKFTSSLGRKFVNKSTNFKVQEIGKWIAFQLEQ